MPSIVLNKKIFEDLVGKKLPIEKLKDRISYLGTDLEKIEGDEIYVEIFPNRPDFLSEGGFARAFSTFIQSSKGLKTYDVKKSSNKLKIDESTKKIRPYTACAIIKGLKLSDERIREIMQIQEKLHISYGRNRKKCAIGIYPLDKIRFPITFLAKKPDEIRFTPLDADRVMTGAEILSRYPKGKEFAHLLAGLERFPIFVDSDDKILSMPPIINSDDLGKITVDTKEFFIECSGPDFRTLNICLNIIVCALGDMGGKIESVELDIYGKKVDTPDLTPKKMRIDTDYINKRLGLELKEDDIKKYIEMMGYGYKNKEALIPAYRADILHQVDLAEDIAIAYGYENFKAKIPKVATIAKEYGLFKFENKIADILAEIGLIEVMNYHLIEKNKQTSLMCLDPEKFEVIELANCTSEEYNTLRKWILPSLFETYNVNKHHEYPQNIFEIGKVFIKDDKKENKVRECTRLAVGLSLETADFTKIKQVLDCLFDSLDKKYKITPVEHPSFIPGRCARVSIKGVDIAYMGEIHPQVLSNWQIEMPIAAFELNLTELFDIIKEEL